METDDLRVYLLNLASRALVGGPIKIYGTIYKDEAAIQKGYEIIDLTRVLERMFRDE